MTNSSPLSFMAGHLARIVVRQEGGGVLGDLSDSGCLNLPPLSPHAFPQEIDDEGTPVISCASSRASP